VSDQQHYIKMHGMSSIVSCSIYWSVGLRCPWCGQDPEPGFYGTGQMTYETAERRESGAEKEANLGKS
jgi:hypothetical protein